MRTTTVAILLATLISGVFHSAQSNAKAVDEAVRTVLDKATPALTKNYEDLTNAVHSLDELLNRSQVESDSRIIFLKSTGMDRQKIVDELSLARTERKYVSDVKEALFTIHFELAKLTQKLRAHPLYKNNSAALDHIQDIQDRLRDDLTRSMKTKPLTVEFLRKNKTFAKYIEEQTRSMLLAKASGQHWDCQHFFK